MMKPKIDWKKPLQTKFGEKIKTVAKLIKHPLDGFNMLCLTELDLIIYANEITGDDKQGPNIENIRKELDWNKPLITLPHGHPCRMVYDKVETKWEGVNFLILIKSGNFDVETAFINKYGQTGSGAERVRNKTEDEIMQDEEDNED